jgi:hypothetical protein
METIVVVKNLNLTPMGFRQNDVVNHGMMKNFYIGESSL